VRDSFWLPVIRPATLRTFFAVAWRTWKQHVRRSAAQVLTTLAALSICFFDGSVAGDNTIHAGAIGYLCLTLVLLGCSCSFWARAWPDVGTLRIRWSLMGAGALAGSMGYAPSFVELFWGVASARLFQTVCFNLSEALFLLACVLFFSGVARLVVIVDTLQALLFVVLRFDLIYSPITPDHFTVNHLLFGQIVALVLFLVAVVACLGAASRSELMFLRSIAWFFGFRLIGFFFSNQVSYLWLHYHNCSLWDVPGIALLAGFALYLFHTKPSSVGTDTAEAAHLHRPSATVSSLMPSLLALVNLLLGLIVLRISMLMAAASISLSVIFYVVRTVLLHTQAVRENTFLQIRNEQLEDLAKRDPLTGLGNRRSLIAAYHELQALQSGYSLALLLLDIDYFKQANDLYGHLYGDEILISLARKLENIASGIAGSHCARFGGDEFAVLLPGISSPEASVLAQKLRADFATRGFQVANGGVSLSIGIASLSTTHMLPLETLISRADQALYRAKMLGRNQVEIQPEWESTPEDNDSAEPLSYLNLS
jgi:diguanylate cyclase (GGDEF)-like protein